MSAFIQPDGGINPIFCSYLVENNEGQLLTRAETLSQRKKKTNLLVPICLLCLNGLRRLQASGGPGIPKTSPPPVGSLLWATPAGVLAPPGGTLPPHRGRSNTEDGRNTTRPLILFAAQRGCVILPQPPTTHSRPSVVPRTRPRAGLGTPGVGSARGPQLHTTTSTACHLNAPAYVNRFPPDWDSQLRPFTRNPLCCGVRRDGVHKISQGLLNCWNKSVSTVKCAGRRREGSQRGPV